MAGIEGLGYQIARADGHCAATGAELPPHAPIVVVLLEAPGDERLTRLEFAADAWDSGARPETGPDEGVFATWRTVRPDPTAKTDPFVDAGSLMELFESLAGADDRRRRVFRYVLALLLMRKKELVYEGQQAGELILRRRGPKDQEREVYRVTDPGMDDEAIAAAVEQVSAVMSGDAS
ncbi:MAG: hypothetical protein AAF138_11655 [Planctomycetota bacterium]